MGDQCYSTQLIDGDGVLNVEALERFIQAARLPDCGVAYSVVSIMGPQSSGKSTLLNHLFGTNFREMDASRGRSITTKGVWIAKSVRIEPCTIVMDLEGTDGEERGEDDTAFENQSTLFALAISDIVLINMWYHDIGRVHAANQPLLKTVFQVMMRLFRPRKTTLLFVIRDHTKTAVDIANFISKIRGITAPNLTGASVHTSFMSFTLTPLQLLEPKLKEDIQKIWDTVFKPQTHKGTTLSEFFNVDVTALPSHENEEQFKEQVAQLRQRIFHTVAPGGLAGDRKDVPGSGFSFSAQEIWKVIRENKDLDLPTHNLMVAKVQCEDIANEKLNRLTSDKDWLELKEAFESPVSDFGRKFGSILDKYLSEYDKEAAYFDESVRTAKRQQLESNALNIVHPAFQAMLGHLHSKALDKFKYDLERSLKSGKAFAVSVRDCTQACMLEFDKGFSDVVIKHSDWDASKVQEKLHRDIEAHAISELRAVYEKQLTEALVEHVGSLLEAAGRDTWASIRQLYKRETENAVSGFSASLSGFELDQSTYHKMVADLKEHARSEVERKAKEEARRVLMHMKDRFSAIFSHDKDSQRRKWTGKEDIRRITKQARAAGLMLLSVMAAIRLDNIQDNIENTLKSTLFPKRRSGEGSIDPLASSIWEEVPPENTLITPVQCKLIWEKFVTETADTVIEAEEAQKDYKRNKEDTIRKNTELAVKIASLLIYAVKGLAQVQSQQH